MLIADWAVGHAYRLTGDLNNAEKLMTPTLEWCKKLNDTEFIGWSYKELGEIETMKEDYTKAIEYFDQAAIYLKRAEMPAWDSEGYQKLLDKIQFAKSKLSVDSN
jgi:tetratricopeptide (TPR) repeat protein